VIPALTHSKRQVASFGTVCLVIRYYLVYCLFIFLDCLFLVAIISHRWLWESLRARRLRLWANLVGEQGKWPLTIFILCVFFFFSSHIGIHALILLPKPHTLGIWVHTSLVMLSHAVLRVTQVFPCFMMLSLACVFVRVLWSSIRWDARWPCEDRCCGLSNGWNGGDG
jgi:hypothetical protein